MSIKRLDQKIKVFTDFLHNVSNLSNSTRLKVSCIALRRDFSRVAAFGYNGSYKGADINQTTGSEEESCDSGLSGFVHAEMNMIAKFLERDSYNYVVLLTHSPCSVCSKILVNAGFKYIFWETDYRETDHIKKIFEKTNITYGNFTELQKISKFVFSNDLRF